jgi:uncharacterized protein (DUF1697 family)
MTTCIALLRGINLVGRNQLSMKDLVAIVEAAGGVEVRTYIQSGNVIFRSRATDLGRLGGRIASLVQARRGFAPRVLVLTPRDLARAVAANPFPAAERDPRSMHVFFLAERPSKPDLEALEAARFRTERFQLTGRLFYLHTPDGFGTSKLAERVERHLGVAATARNWRTVTTLDRMARS